MCTIDRGHLKGRKGDKEQERERMEVEVEERNELRRE